VSVHELTLQAFSHLPIFLQKAETAGIYRPLPRPIQFPAFPGVRACCQAESPVLRLPVPLLIGILWKFWESPAPYTWVTPRIPCAIGCPMNLVYQKDYFLSM